MTTIGNLGRYNQNDNDDMLVWFAGRNNLKIMNTFFVRKASKMWKNPNGETKNEIDFFLTNKLNTVKNMVLLSKLKCDHRMMRSKVTLDFKKETSY